MNLPRKVFFFGLRRQFNKAVDAFNGLATSMAKLVITVIELEVRLAALEKRANMEDLLDGLQARYDAIIIENEEEETDEDTEERTED
jgi:hypothetical protein